jgi:pimeloyl-ACP methyl ester carboxylesterase
MQNQTPTATAFTVLVMSLWLSAASSMTFAQQPAWPAKTYYRYQPVDGQKMFYREAGDPSAPAIVLLHGFPSSSHTYRELIPLLSGKFHIIAPDNLGSGYSDHPDPDKMTYSFDFLANYVSRLISSLGLEHYSLYMQDFGAPVGFRVLLQQPERIDALIIQNANAYLDGLTDVRQAFFRNAHEDRSEKGIESLNAFVGRESIIYKQYLRDVKGKESVISPDSWTHDLAFLQTEKDRKIQVQLFQDYFNNIRSYPKWQAFLHQRQPRTLIVWGINDPAFIPAGARAYLRDLPNAELHWIDAGHFAVEENAVEIAKHITLFLEKRSGP